MFFPTPSSSVNHHQSVPRIVQTIPDSGYDTLSLGYERKT